MSLFRLLLEVVGDALDRGESKAKRTLCCDVKMWDLWMHDRDCPNFLAACERVKANGGRNPPFKRGDKSSLCPYCGFPSGLPGVYVVGERCPYCEYLEKRRP